MDFLDPHKKRTHQRRLFLGYFLIAVAIILGSLILLLQAYGYDVDRKTGQIIQNGLIFADSAPEKASIFLNGKENGTTDKRLTVPAGSYTVELKRGGYHDWKRTFNLEAGSIEQLVYPMLIPNQLNTTDRQAYAATPTFASQSPDRRWIVVAPGPAFNKLDIFEANDPKKASTSITLPNGILSATKGAETLELVEWANDNRHLLVKHVYNDNTASEFIVIDRESVGDSINVNKHLSLNPTSITLRDKKFDQLYLWDTNGVLRFADTKTKQVTPLLENILVYKSYGEDMILYAQRDPADGNKTVVKLKDDEKTYTLRRGAAEDTYLVDLARYDDHWYMAVATAGKVYIYRDPMNENTDDKALPSLFTSLIMEEPTQLIFSANTRFILAQSGRKFAVYDTDTNRRYYYESELALAPTTKATWMDGHRLLVNHDNKVVVFDYDGINQHSLVPIAGTTKAFFDRDYTRLYTIGPSREDAAKAALTQTDLKNNL